nr:hypothetical protein [Candidatus Njordarchaeum guaymaensis]
MAVGSEEDISRTLDSIKKSLAALNKSLSYSLRRLEEAIFRISALGEVHIKLAKTLMDVLGIPEEVRPSLAFPPAPVEPVESVERAESVVSGLLRGIVMSLTKSCGEIAKAMTASKQEINKLIGNFDAYEMEVLAKQLGKWPERVLDPDERIAYREKIRKWHRQLIEAFEKP